MEYKFTRDIDPKIFRAYDIRGIAGETLTCDIIYSIGRVLGSRLVNFVTSSQALVARDGRLSSPELSDALIQGLLDSGCDVVDIGEVPTPVLYFATHHTSIKSGIMITGSHNPGNYNGLKIVLDGNTLSQYEIYSIYLDVVGSKCSNGRGECKNLSIKEDYINRILEDISIDKKIKVVTDCGNGVAGHIVPHLFKSLGCEVIELFSDVDGTFPNHHPDPCNPQNLVALKETTLREHADVGIAFDGDADRLGIVTQSGDFIEADKLLMVYLRDILASKSDEKVIYDVKCSRSLSDLIAELGSIPIMSPTGHSIIKKKMKESGAIFAGEMSGHIFFNDRWYGFDDGIYAAARLIEIISNSNEKNIFEFLPQCYSESNIELPMKEEDKFKFMSLFKENSKFPGAKITTIDGVRVEYSNRWGVLRASNTSPCLVTRFEADSKESLDLIIEEFMKQISLVESMSIETVE